MKSKSSSGGLVYSTEHGRMCPGCRQPLEACTCQQVALPSGDGIVRVNRENKGRGGKTVTLVKGVLRDSAGLTALGKQLKNACGSGGTVKDGIIEIQGDHVVTVMATLQKLGFQVKRAGG